MKKLLCIILIISMTSTSYAGIFDGLFGSMSTNTETTAARDDNLFGLAAKLRDIVRKDSVKKFFNIEDGSVEEYLQKLFLGIDEETKTKIRRIYPSLSLDGIESIEDIYKLLSEIIKIELKYAVDNGEITNESIKEAALPLAMFGITIPEINLSYNMADEELDRVCMLFADAIDQITNTFALDLFPSIGESVKNEIENLFGK